MAKTRVTIIGLGETGRALAAGMRKAISDAELIGHDKDLATARKAEGDKLIDKVVLNLFNAMEGAALVLFCLPLEELVKTLHIIGKDAPKDAILIDTAPSKAAALKAAGALPADVTYISSSLVLNPNGTGDPRPIRGATWVFSPRAGADEAQVGQAANLASAMEATPVFMDALEHDGLNIAARTLPAAASVALFAALAGDGAWRERKWLAGDGLKHASLALEGTSAGSLAAALLADKATSTHWLNQTMLQLMALREAIAKDDAAALTAQIQKSRDAREEWLADWQRGRETGVEITPMQRPSFMSLFTGERLADAFRRRDKK